jgi:hypothetical protein
VVYECVEETDMDLLVEECSSELKVDLSASEVSMFIRAIQDFSKSIVDVLGIKQDPMRYM